MDTELVLSCEHAGNKIPESYMNLFESGSSVLKTHRGYDIGALDLTHTIGAECEVEPHIHTITRLLVDLNRSLDHPTAFSEFIEEVERDERDRLVQQHYLPHRNKVEKMINEIVHAGDRVVHLSVHTFTPIWEGKERETDIGLLFDPARPEEVEFCALWKEYLEEMLPELNIQDNVPYTGTADSFSTYLRARLEESQYLGLEIEVNQKFPEQKDEYPERWERIQQKVGESLRKTIQNRELAPEQEVTAE